jgi:hypothetical protein
MRVSRVRFVAFVCLYNFCLWSNATGQASDQTTAERALGSQWRHISRQAGMIFCGTVVNGHLQTAATNRTPPQLQFTFRVDEAIAGVETGQTLTIREWTGAVSMQRPMLSGQHFLIFLYPPSRLGLTSPVGGPLGQINLDASGKYVSQHPKKPPRMIRSQSSAVAPISVMQLERAIRSARAER